MKSKDSKGAAEHTPLMKHHGRMFCICMFLKNIVRDRTY